MLARREVSVCLSVHLSMAAAMMDCVWCAGASEILYSSGIMGKVLKHFHVFLNLLDIVPTKLLIEMHWQALDMTIDYSANRHGMCTFPRAGYRYRGVRTVVCMYVPM